MIIQDEEGAVQNDLPIYDGAYWRHKTLTAGSNVTITVSASAITITGAAGGAANPGGSANQVQYNSAGTAFAGFTMSGDATLVVATGVITVAANAITTAKINNAAVTYAKVQNVAATALVGNPTGSPAAPSEITLGANLSFSGTTLVASGGGSGTVNSGTSGQVAYYGSTGTAVSGEGLSALIDAAIGSTQGDVLYRGASTWGVLAPGTNGQVLATGGAAANPSWIAAGGTGTVTSIVAGTGLSGGTITTTGTIALSTVTAALGGTGLTTLTAHGVMLGEGTSNVAFATIGTAGRVLVDQGSGADPVFTTTGLQIDSHQGVITVDADASTVTFNLATSDWHQTTLGGNRTFAVSNAAVGQQFSLRVIQAAAGGPYTPTWFSTINWLTPTLSAPTMPTTASAVMVVTFKCTSAGNYDGFLSGPGSASSTGTVNSGTTGQIAYYAASGTAISGEGLSALIDSAIGSTQGDILYRGSSAWAVLAPGTSGYVLTSGGAAANPSWASGGGGGGSPGGSANQLQYYATSSTFGGATDIAVGANGQLNLASISTPGTQVEGDLWTDATQKCVVVFDGSTTNADCLNAYRVGLIFSQVTPVTQSTPTAASLVSTTNAVGKVAWPANYLNMLGRTIRIRAGGYYTAGSGGGACTLSFLLGGNVIATNLGAGFGATHSNQTWYIDATITVASTGSSGTINTVGTEIAYGAGATTLFAYNFCNGTTAGTQAPQTPVTVNLTSALAFDFQVTYSGTGDSFSCTNLTIEALA